MIKNEISLCKIRIVSNITIAIVTIIVFNFSLSIIFISKVVVQVKVDIIKNIKNNLKLFKDK
jgi:hypothetical protein